jgi:pimeloyl-ACP methyl ester carboxylesterase
VPKVRVNDIHIHYQQAGPADGEPLLLIMGWGGDHTAWAFQVPAFAEAFRVISPDNRGAGQSDQPDTPYTIAGMAEDLVGLLDRLDIGSAHVSGASMGGMIAQEIALKHPERARTLQLHCTLARPDAYGKMLVESLLQVRDRSDREEFARAILPWILTRGTVGERPDFVELLIQTAAEHPYPTTPAALRRQAEAIGGHDSLDRLAGLRMPTLITVGAEDILVPPAFSRELHARIPDSELAIIPDAAHLHFMEQPERFNGICLAFLRKHRAR